MIPEGWTIEKLEYLGQVERGKFTARPRNNPKLYGGDIPFVQTGDIRSASGWLKSYSQTLNEEGLAVSRIFPAGTILVTIAANIGDVAITAFPVACPDSIVAIQTSNTVSNIWLMYVLQTHKDDLDSLSTQNAQKNINLEILRPFEVLTPPLEEQRKIAAILSTWDEAIGLVEQLIGALGRRKQALMQLLLTGAVRFAGFEQSEEYKTTEFGEIPADWCIKRFGDLFSMSSGSTPSRTTPEFFEGNILWVTSGELNYGLIYDTKERVTNDAVKDANLGLYPAGTFLMAITGLEAAGTRGRCGILGAPATVNQSCMAFEKSNEVDTLYLFHFYLRFGETIAFNYAQGTKQQSLPQRILSIVPICYPPSLGEQQKIIDILENCDRELELYATELATLKEQKRGLMQQLLTGAVRV